MSKWINIKTHWKLRPTMDGLEFITYDKNINLDTSNNNPKEQEDILLLLKGIRSYDSGKQDNNFKNIVNELQKHGVISISNFSRFYESSSSEELLWKIRKRMVGRRGPIQRVYWLDPSRSKYYPKNATLFSTKYISKTGCENKKMIEWTSGIDADPTISELKAVMEGVERFYSGEVAFDELIRKNELSLGRSAVSSTELISYLKEQYRTDLIISPYSPRKTYLWKSAKNITEGKEVYVPIDLIYYPLEKKYAPHLLTFGNSNGIASGFTYEETLLRSLYEVIERDAFMIVWLNRLSLPKLDKKSLSKAVENRIKKIESLGLEIYIINITLDTIPVILVAALNILDHPVLLLGAASNLDILKAIDKALSEVEQGVYWEYRDDSRMHKVIDPKKVLKVKEHVSLFRNIRYIKEAEFLWKGKIVPVSKSNEIETHAHFENLVRQIMQNGNKILVVDISPEELKDLGVIILRSYILGFIPISFGYGLEPLGMRRIYDIPKMLNMKTDLWKRFPPLPHPFP